MLKLLYKSSLILNETKVRCTISVLNIYLSFALPVWRGSFGSNLGLVYTYSICLLIF